MEEDNKSFKYSSIENTDGSDRVDDNTKFTRNERPNEFGYGKMSIRQGNKYTEQIMDINRKPLLPASIEFLVKTIQGHKALVEMSEGFVFIDLHEKINETYLENQIHYDFACPYSCGLALVDLNEKSFFIDEKGKRVFDTNFEFAESFYEGTALVKNANKYFIINTNGEKIADVNYDQISSYSPQVWQVINIKKETYKSGFIDRTGRQVSEIIYDEVYYSEEWHRGWVRIKNKFGFLDEYGQVIIPIKYDAAEIFNNQGQAFVKLGDREFYINVSGKEEEEK
ncbi:MAG: WG repeat-containing protein [Pedobacter sp.]|uniref:WG repeat-containing protein n=1 Tax=Pedobacter sp. TaxID=1411316 RepID=UPI0035691719